MPTVDSRVLTEDDIIQHGLLLTYLVRKRIGDVTGNERTMHIVLSETINAVLMQEEWINRKHQ